MSSVGPELCMQKLWNHIIQSHYDYLSEEEPLKQIDQRAKLEKQLKRFLSRVQNDRKFFLPVTRRVLRETIRKNTDCSLHQTGMGFVAIHQFANNLWSKTWRPEYKTIKTYSGFYQQEIHSHLIDAELMFHEMGYRKQANGTLILKGTLCMDQVANVSRDALSAYVECQLMSEIFAGMVQLQCKPLPSCADIFAVREQHSGDVEQTIELLFERNRKNGHYGFAAPTAVSCNNCNGQLPAAFYSTPSSAAPCPQHNNQSHSVYVNQQFGPADVAREAIGHMAATPSPPPPPLVAAAAARYMKPSYSNSHGYAHHQHHHHQSHPHPSAIPHSRSLDQYYDQNAVNAAAAATAAGEHSNKRHSSSFDQPGYNGYNNGTHQQHHHQHHHHVYDTVAGDMMQPPLLPSSSSTGYAPINAYNISGNRCPIPTTVSNQFASQYGQHPGGQRHCAPQAYDHYGQFGDEYSHRSTSGNRAAAAAAPPAVTCDHMTGDAIEYATLSSTAGRHRHRHEQFGGEVGIGAPVSSYAQTVKQSRSANTQTTHQQLDHHHQHHGGGGASSLVDMADGFDHLHRAPLLPTPIDPQHVQQRPSRRSQQSSYFPPTAQPHYEDAGAPTNGSRTSRGISDFDSTDEQAQSSSGVYASKCSDGIGSYGTWNYVYTQLEKDGYSKDLGERADLLQAEQLAEDQRGVERNGRSTLSASLLASAKKTMRGGAAVGPHEPVTSTNKRQSADRTATKPKDATTLRKSTEANGEAAERSNRSHRNGSTRRKSKEIQTPASGGDLLTASPKEAATAASVQPIRRNRSPAAITEWTCTHCTLLNPMSERVCAVCAHSKDFVAVTGSAKAKATTTCV